MNGLCHLLACSSQLDCSSPPTTFNRTEVPNLICCDCLNRRRKQPSLLTLVLPQNLNSKKSVIHYDDMENVEYVWDNTFSSPEYLYKIILVCMFFGFIIFMGFFALVKYLRIQNKARAILFAQQERERASQFPPRLDLLIDGDPFEGQEEGVDIPLVETISEVPAAFPASSATKTSSCCTCNPVSATACVCVPLTTAEEDDDDDDEEANEESGLNKET